MCEQYEGGAWSRGAVQPGSPPSIHLRSVDHLQYFQYSSETDFRFNQYQYIIYYCIKQNIALTFLMILIFIHIFKIKKYHLHIKEETLQTIYIYKLPLSYRMMTPFFMRRRIQWLPWLPSDSQYVSGSLSVKFSSPSPCYVLKTYLNK